jgi:hypothetical protein
MGHSEVASRDAGEECAASRFAATALDELLSVRVRARHRALREDPSVLERVRDAVAPRGRALTPSRSV